ncbi:hypothetical protein FA13DRAFT_1754234 [Coprinellus micaceus]|uniref:Tyrosinase copper-binding domain-containing protein n=1 Tax=Coprinellus micaceus TaxID=71717 RepID=A0A4Y7TG40_COPMI|nr:hypothetical protein FA13DRAFT_1754234 [Coprinellus micaceus]
MFNNSGSRRWTHFHSALQLAVQRSAHKWTFEDFTECFPLYVEEDKNSASATFNSISDYIEAQNLRDLDKLFKEYNVQENVDILHKIVQDSKDRKSKGEIRNDAWRENINPRTSICAKTIPVVEKDIARLQRQLKEAEDLNRELLRELEEEARQTDEVNGHALEIVQQVDRACEEWEGIPQDEIEPWTVENLDSDTEDSQSQGHFLPWHRQFTVVHEMLLRDECQYIGPIPVRDSPIFDPETGFGGDGVPGTYTLPGNYSTLDPSKVPINPAAFKGCVQDGPFASSRITLGPGKLVTEHCLVRGINETYRRYINPGALRNTIKRADFESFRIELEGRPVTPAPKLHDAVHVFVGGDMSNFYSSVAGKSPQHGFGGRFVSGHGMSSLMPQMKPVKRLYAITGRSTVYPPYSNVTLDFKLDFGSLSPSVAIRDVMNIHAEPGRYTYV